MCPVWLFDVIPGQHTNLGRLFRSFTIGILICILKAKWVYSQAIFYFSLIFFTRNICPNYTDVHTGPASGNAGGNTDVRARRGSGNGEGSQKLTKSQYFGSS